MCVAAKSFHLRFQPDWKVFLWTTSERRWNAGETWVEFWVLTLFRRQPFWTTRWETGWKLSIDIKIALLHWIPERDEFITKYNLWIFLYFWCFSLFFLQFFSSWPIPLAMSGMCNTSRVYIISLRSHLVPKFPNQPVGDSRAATWDDPHLQVILP